MRRLVEILMILWLTPFALIGFVVASFAQGYVIGKSLIDTWRWS
jgi:hypothetical protein